MLFIDGSNFYQTIKKLQFKIDYQRFLEYFNAQFQLKLKKAFYYSAYDPSQAFIMRILDKLEHLGYQIIRKKIKKVGQSTVKGNLDIEMTIDVIKHMPYYTTAILATGDGDFKPLVEYLQQNQKQVYCISSKRTHPPLVSYELLESVDKFIELQDIIPYIQQITT